MAVIDEEVVVEGLKEVVGMEKEWIGKGEGR